MKCPICGTINAKGSERCRACGRALGRETGGSQYGGGAAGPSMAKRLPLRRSRDGRAAGQKTGSSLSSRKNIIIAIFVIGSIALYVIIAGFSKQEGIRKTFSFLIVLLPILISVVQTLFQQYLAGIDYPEKHDRLHDEAENTMRKLLSPRDQVVAEAMSMKPSPETLLVATANRLLIVEKVFEDELEKKFSAREVRFNAIERISRNPLSGVISVRLTPAGALSLAIPSARAATAFVNELKSRIGAVSGKSLQQGGKPLRNLCILCGEEAEGDGFYCAAHSAGKSN